ncbi:MAG: poly-gamma-glutamate biosynthesis protein PgsC [Leptospiraceae bacterium]|nr:poly-gamma-glutamate biosynthesis protein PgsC [Leptospiraceae bacterium]
MDLLSVSIGVGLGVSLLFSEFLGLATGGMIVPGYMALHLSKPLEIVMTLAAAFITFVVVRVLASIIIIYGKRRTVFMVLIGYLVGYTIRIIAGSLLHNNPNIEYGVIGYIIPGLIAIWYDRQGFIETTTSLIIASVLVRLLLIIFLGQELKV